MRQLVRAKRHKMVRAFAVLQQQREGAEPVVGRADWNQLVQLVQTDISSAHRELLWSVCDDKNQGYIGTALGHMRTQMDAYAQTYTHTHKSTHLHTSLRTSPVL